MDLVRSNNPCGALVEAIRLSGGDTKQRGLDVVVGARSREEEHVLFPLVVAFEMIMA